VEYKSKGDTGNNWGDWDHFKIILKILEKLNRKLQKTAILGTTHTLRKVLM